jgi:16S rRNA processing protein RimM
MSETKSGSPKGESIYLAVGFLRRPHGVMGEILMDLHTDFPERFKSGRKVYLGPQHEAATLGSVRAHAENLLIKIRGCDTPESVGKYRNTWVYVKASEVPPLPQGQVYKYELIGLDVIDDAGNSLGKLTEILETGANDVYVVRDDKKEILLPAIPDVILKIDMESKVMTVHLIDGLV